MQRKLTSRVYDSMRTLLWTAREEPLDAPYPLRRRLYWWRRGFMAESASVYDLPRNDPADYVNDYVRRHRCRKINPVPALFDHKLLLRSILLQHGFRQAETVAFIAGGAIQMFPFGSDRRWASAQELESYLLRDGGRFVIKPESATRGTGVASIEVDDGQLVRRRGGKSAPFVVPMRGSPKLIERSLCQGALWSALNPTSANSIRVLTMWTSGEPAPFVAAAVQRIGVEATAPTDNWSAGGICAPVDLGTGRLGRGRMHPRKGRAAQPYYTHHPETGAPIEGSVLPCWEAVKETVLRACERVPLIRYAGWDVMVDDTDTPVIIEANNNSDVNLLQVHGGLLRRPEVRRFYERYGVL